MKNIPLKVASRGRIIARLQLGSVYQIQDGYGTTRYGKLIKSTEKGFNFLDTLTSRCFFNKAVYQVNSKNKCIGRTQTCFEIVLPDHVRVINLLEKGDGEFVHLTKNEIVKPSTSPASEVEHDDPLEGIEIL